MSAPLTASQMICFCFILLGKGNWNKAGGFTLHSFIQGLWCSQLIYEDTTALTLGGLYFGNKIILPIQTLWKYNKTVLFFTMLPWICHNRLPAAVGSIQLSGSCEREVMAGLGNVQPRFLEAADVSFISSRGHTASRAPLHHLYLTLCFPVKAAWFIIQIRGICIVTIPLSRPFVAYDLICSNGSFYLHQ